MSSAESQPSEQIKELIQYGLDSSCPESLHILIEEKLGAIVGYRVVLDGDLKPVIEFKGLWRYSMQSYSCITLALDSDHNWKISGKEVIPISLDQLKAEDCESDEIVIALVEALKKPQLLDPTQLGALGLNFLTADLKVPND